MCSTQCYIVSHDADHYFCQKLMIMMMRRNTCRYCFGKRLTATNVLKTESKCNEDISCLSTRKKNIAERGGKDHSLKDFSVLNTWLLPTPPSSTPRYNPPSSIFTSTSHNLSRKPHCCPNFPREGELPDAKI